MVVRWIAGVLLALAVYAAFGFWAVPAVIRHQVPKMAESMLARQATVGEVAFNPFTLRFTTADLSLAEADGTPLLSTGGLLIELQWRSVVRRAWSFAEIRITDAKAHLLIEPDGKFNLAELLASIDRQPREPSRDDGLPRLVIERFAVERGQVDMQDRRAGYANLFSPIDFELAHFSTLPNQNDAHALSAESSRGGKLRWKGTASVNPIKASGEFILETIPLSELSVYLRSYTRATLAAGELSATLPYSLSYDQGKLEARLSGAKASVNNIAVSIDGAGKSFAELSRLDLDNVNADLAARQLTVATARASGGRLEVTRNAQGEVSLANLARAAPSSRAVALTATPMATGEPWKFGVEQLMLDDLALSAVDETVRPALKVQADQLRLKLRLSAALASDTQLNASGADFSLANLEVGNGDRPALKLARFGFTGGQVDLAARSIAIGTVVAEGGHVQIQRNSSGDLNLLSLLPKGGAGAVAPAPKPTAGKPWSARVDTIELSRFGADVEDQGTGIKVHVTDMKAKLDGVGSDLRKPVKFSAALGLREGGQFTAQGSAVPATAAVQADVQVKQMALAPLQPLLAQHLKLKIAKGHVSARGQLTASPAERGAGLRYRGGLNIADLALHEADGELFASWKNVDAQRLSASLGPDRLNIPELRIVDANAKLIIEDDRSLNAARLLVKGPAARVKPAKEVAAAAPPSGQAFPVSVGRVRLENAKLDFADLSLRPQFAAKMYEMNGVVVGLSTNGTSQSQIELDSRVDEFGSARIRGTLNPFAPQSNTDVSLVFKNVDMVSASPYTMKFAGYKIAEGKISLDLQYKVRDNQLAGTNQIVIDKLTLGERVDSPDALKLPLELAIAILKDSDGRIDLGLPVSGDMSDPQFSYGALVWKAIGSLLTRIVTAPFRALGSMLGLGGAKLESIDFDPGSDTVAPPEREKLAQVAQLLVKRAQLNLSVPGQYDEAADGAALRMRAVRAEIERRAGQKPEAGRDPGPVDLGERATRSAVRDLYAARFGDGELDRQRKAAQSAPPAGAAASGRQAAGSQPPLALWQRVGKMVQGEPQVADASAFYNQLLERLYREQPLAPDALANLGARRSDAIVKAIRTSGIEAGRATSGEPEKLAPGPGRSVSVQLKLGLAAK